MTLPDPVQVELVGQSWWAQAAPYLAIVISLVSVGLTLWFRYTDGARLSVHAKIAIPLGSSDKSPWIQLEAINVGRLGTTLTSLSLEAKDGRTLAMLSTPHPLSARLPLRLDPGSPAHVYLPVREAIAACITARIDIDELWVAGESGHTRTRKRLNQSLRRLLAGYGAEENH